MKKESNLSYWDYATNYYFAVASLAGSVYCFAHGFVHTDNRRPFIIGGFIALGVASLKGLLGYVNLRKIKKLNLRERKSDMEKKDLQQEILELRERLEERVDD